MELQNGTKEEEEAERMKEKGNECFRLKKHEEALEYYNQAIALNPRGSHLYYSNRSSCLGALGRWNESAADAKMSLELAPPSTSFTKGYFRLAKAQIELQQFTAASESIATVLRDDRNNADLLKLQKMLIERRNQLIKTVKDPRRKPTPNELQTIRELGHGNFTRILEVLHRDTKETFALKVIEKSQIGRVKKRHPNVINEISMERRILSRLRHSNIIELYHAFQDYTSLYLLLEYCGGGEIWQKLQSNGMGIGVPLSLARFYTTEVIAALEFLHSKGIIHRDLKPENMVLTSTGRLKLIDFGSAKDTVETDLNGPEFVGTPEYMCPQAIKNRETLMEGDLWALGCCIFQFISGISPFKAASAYLIFLRAQRCNPRYPSVIPPPARDLISRLIRRLPEDRLGSFSHPDEASRGYETLKAHPFFEGSETHFGSPDHIITTPSARESALQDMAQQCITQAMQFEPDTQLLDNLAALSREERAVVGHLLERQGKLIEPRILRLVLPAGKDRLLARIDASGKEVFGLGLAQQEKWKGPFSFVYIGGLEGKGGGASSWSDRLMSLQKTVQGINRLRPRFVVVSGDLMEEGEEKQSGGGDGIDHEEEKRGVTKESGSNGIDHEAEQATEEVWERRREEVLKILTRISESIPVLIVPSRGEKGPFYGFWYGGVRGLVLRGGDGGLPSKEEENWVVEELEQGRFSAQHLLAFVPKAWVGGKEGMEGGISPRLRRWALSKMQGRETRLKTIIAPACSEGGGRVIEVVGRKEEGGIGDSDDDSDSSSSSDKEEKELAEEREKEEEEEELLQGDDDEPHAKVLQILTDAVCIVEVYREKVVPTFMGLEELPSSVSLQAEAPHDNED